MKYPVLAFGVLLAAAAHADTASDFVFYDAQIQAMQHRVDAAATSPSVNREALTALQGKQQELANQEAKLKAAGTMTPDEKSALAITIRQQQQRLNGLSRTSAPAVQPVDPASVPAPTYVTPSGTTISSAPGTTPEQNGVVPLINQMMGQPAAQPQTTTSTMHAPTIQGPSVPVIHSPGAVTETPAQQ